MTKKQFITSFINEWEKQKNNFINILDSKKISMNRLVFTADAVFIHLSKIFKIGSISNIKIVFSFSTMFTDDKWITFELDIRIYSNEIYNQILFNDMMVEQWEKLEP